MNFSMIDIDPPFVWVDGEAHTFEEAVELWPWMEKYFPNDEK